MKLSCLVRDAAIRRKRCAPICEELAELTLETITTCNICDAAEVAVLTVSDRYGLPVRSGMCLRCGLIFLLDRFTAEGYTRFYQDYYRALGSVYLNRPITPKTLQEEQRRYARSLIETFRGLLPLPAGTTLIDVGGSTGVVATEFAGAYGMAATVLDPSPDELEQARAAGHTTMCTLFETWEGTDEQFDLVLCNRTIDHFLDLKRALEKLRSLCKPSGYLLIDIVDVEMIRKRKGMLEGAIKVDHPYYLCNEIAAAILQEAGFAVVYREIASSPERVTYLCRPGEVVQKDQRPSAAWIRQRLRGLHENHLAVVEARRQPCDWRDVVRRKGYRLKNKLLRRSA